MSVRVVFQLIASSALLFATLASAAPAYVTCEFTYKGKPEVRKFTLNEDTGKVSIFYPETAESQTLQAAFTAENVIFETYSERYAIIRTSLTGIRQAKLDGKIEQVQCRLETPPKRAF
ncbi:MAG: hypothetical protein U9R07_15750 [Pseudomonadota bacterium]|nr:hypothetical protein [Pseudomonadota bacterium]